MLRSMRIVVICFIALIVQGCTLLPVTKPVRSGVDQLDIPEMWRTSGEGNEGEISAGWLDTFNDPAMVDLVSEALNRNQGIRISEANLRFAQQSLVFGRAPRLPSFSVSGSASGSGSKTRDAAGDLSPWRNSESYGLTASASWELDLWGRLRDLHQAARYDYAANQADFRGARLSLAATTAKAWCNLIAAKQQLALAVQTRESFERNFRITERNYKAGDSTASPLSVQFAGNNVASAQRSVISRQLALDEATRTLEILLGRYPATEIEARDTLPDMPDDIPTGLPSELLMRRPDLVAAANDLLASAERSTTSRKHLLPAINLSGRGSVGSSRIADLLVDPTSIARSVGASLSQPIFQGGRLKAQVRQAAIRNEIAMESFIATSLRAFREVESAIARDISLAEQEKFLEVEFSQANLAETQANRDYSEGIVNIIQVLEAQRRAFNARNSRISLRNQRLQNRIDLHLALGGDFSTTPMEWAEDAKAESDLPKTEDKR